VLGAALGDPETVGDGLAAEAAGLGEGLGEATADGDEDVDGAVAVPVLQALSSRRQAKQKNNQPRSCFIKSLRIL
jgi:hypothetical protein